MMIRNLLLIAAFVTCATGCTKSEKTTASMSASINGNAFSAIGFHVTAKSSPQGTVTITGINQSNSTPTTIMVTVLNAAGTYNFDATHNTGDVSVNFSSPDTQGKPIEGISGQVRIISTSASSVQGTFSFAAQDGATTYSVLNGQFTGTF